MSALSGDSRATIDGVVVVDKPPGLTSHDVVGRMRRIYSQRRVGHAGTLDPDATGVLVVGLGRATRLLRYLSADSKSYRTEVVFGVATDTLDASGNVLDRRPMELEPSDIEGAVKAFLGDIYQIPPMVSAVKIGGRRLYEIARQGKEVERPPRPVTIHRFELEDLESGPYPKATFLIECGSGTYVRSLAADLGAALGGFAHVCVLRRISSGPFLISEAKTIEEIEDAPADAVVPTSKAMSSLERLEVSAEVARAVQYGAVFPSTSFNVTGDGPFAVIGPTGDLMAIYERRGPGFKPAVVMSGPPAGQSASETSSPVMPGNL